LQQERCHRQSPQDWAAAASIPDQAAMMLALHLNPAIGILSFVCLSMGALSLASEGDAIVGAAVGGLGAALFLLAAVVGQP
jgi:hypothetical protein